VKKILIIAPYPHNEAPSQRFRFEQYFDFLRDKNISWEFRPFLDKKTWKKLYAEGNVFAKMFGVLQSFLKRFFLLFTLWKYDFIFIHREASHIGPPIFEWLIAKVLRKKYIYDFDDAIWLPNYSESNASFHKLKMYWKVNYCMKWAYKVTAGNEYLANYAAQFNKNVQIIPTTIDTINHHNLQTDYDVQKPVIGWTGTHTTMRYLDFLVPVIAELEKKYDFDFTIISNEAPTFPLKSLKYIKWNIDSEIKDLATISIGVMPLVQDIWSEGKCGFKGLQYMALGIPSLMSPVGVNNQIIDHGVNGFLLTTEEEWKNCLEELLKNATLRKEIGLRGKQTILERYSVLANQDKYLNLFQ
jgi:glycosyltransferase involved in cell wall biosynthesis